MAGKSEKWFCMAALFLLGVMAAELILSVRRQTQTWDEGAHLFAGYTYWKHADFGQNPEHPPFVKLLSALPLLSMRLKEPAGQHGDSKIDTFVNGKDFLYQNDADRMLLRARIAAALLSLALALAVFLTGREMFGSAAGLLAMLLLVFEPNVLANGALVTTDIGVSIGILVAVYCFYRYVKTPSWTRLLLAGVGAGLALVSKHSGLLILPTLAVLAGCEVLRASNWRKTALQHLGSLAAISLIAVAMLWSSYGFRYKARPDGLDLKPTLSQSVNRLSPFEARVISAAARFHLLPEAYLYGVADVRWTANFSRTYLWGRMYPHGVWFYFPAAFVVKATLGFMTLCLVALVGLLVGRLTRWRETLFLIVPSVIYMAVAMNTGLNLGVRHILSLFVFLCLLIAGTAWALTQRNPRWAYVVAALALFHIVSSARAYPHYIAYANEAFGGPANTYKYLSGANTDWGQQLKSVKQYLKDRGIHDCWFAYFAQTAADPRYYEIPCKPLPVISSIWLGEHIDAPPEVDGTVLVSAGTLTGFQFGPGVLNPYNPFVDAKPTDYIDYGVFVYEGRFPIPLVSAIAHTDSAYRALRSGESEVAFVHAQTAVNLAPNDVASRVCLGVVLSVMNRPEEARRHYQRALVLARSVHPEFQKDWIPTLENKLEAK